MTRSARTAVTANENELLDAARKGDEDAFGRLVGPYRPRGQPRGTTQQGITDNGRPRMRRATVVLQRGRVMRAAPSPMARAARSRFWTLG